MITLGTVACEPKHADGKASQVTATATTQDKKYDPAFQPEPHSIGEIQGHLNAMKIPDKHGKPLIADGELRLETSQSIAHFQQLHGLPGTGLADALTVAAIGEGMRANQPLNAVKNFGSQFLPLDYRTDWLDTDSHGLSNYLRADSLARLHKEIGVDLVRDNSMPSNSSAKLVSKPCGGSEMFLLANGARFETTSLHIATKDRRSIDLSDPSEMKGYTPIGLGCAPSRNGSPYFIVQYGELPFGCKFCEWFYLYDADGNRLTSSTPPLLSDNGLPGENREYPNNTEFDELARKLGLDITAIIDSMSFVTCRTPVDDDGALGCDEGV